MGNNMRPVLGWCFESLRIIQKFIRLSKDMEKRGFQCIWLCRSKETAYALLANGIPAHSVEEFARYFDEIVQYGSSINQDNVESLIDFDKAIDAHFTPFPKTVSSYHETQAFLYTGIYSLLIHYYKPVLILNLNGISCVSKTLTLLARKFGIPCFFLENGLLPDTLVFDSTGVNYGSHMAGENWLHLSHPQPTIDEKKRLDKYKEKLIASSRTLLPTGQEFGKEQILKALNIPEGKKIIMVPLQDENDTNIVYYSPIFKQMEIFVRETGKIFAGDENTFLIVKEHPQRNPEVAKRSAAECTGNMRYVNDISLPSLLGITDLVICLNSTVGLEALLRGIPVTAFAKSTYAEKGFTYDAFKERNTSPSEFKSKASQSFNQDRFDAFLLYLLREHLYPVTDEADAFGSRQRLLSKLSLASTESSPSYEKLPFQKLSSPIYDALINNQNLLCKFNILRQTENPHILIYGNIKPGMEPNLRNAFSSGIPNAVIESGNESHSQQDNTVSIYFAGSENETK